MKKLSLLAVVASMLIAQAGYAAPASTSPKGLEIPIEKAAYKLTTDVADGGYKIVGTEELKKWLDDGKKVTIISALPASANKESGLLPSAVSCTIPRDEKELTQKFKDSLLQSAGADKEKPIVIYCGYVACGRSHLGAKILVENGYKNVYRYPGGIAAWQEMGYPVTKLLQ